MDDKTLYKDEKGYKIILRVQCFSNSKKETYLPVLELVYESPNRSRPISSFDTPTLKSKTIHPPTLLERLMRISYEYKIEKAVQKLKKLIKIEERKKYREQSARCKAQEIVDRVAGIDDDGLKRAGWRKRLEDK